MRPTYNETKAASRAARSQENNGQNLLRAYGGTEWILL